MGILLYRNIPHSVRNVVNSLESSWRGIIWKPCQAFVTVL